MNKKLPALAAATAMALVTIGPATMATAHTPPRASTPATLASGLVGALHLSVGPDKAVTVSESFASRLTHVTRRETTTRDTDPDWSLGGVAHKGSTLYFLESQGAGPEDARPLAGRITSIDARGRVRMITDKLGAHEAARNPDGRVRYGLSASDAAAHPTCVAQLAAINVSASPTGEVDSHPYGLAVVGNTAYVADAGANAVLKVNLSTGHVRTLAVLPARPSVISKAAADQFGVPACAGLTYAWESVPTDVEVGPDGKLYVSSLPGGPEDDSLGDRGAVFRVDPRRGSVKLVVENVLSPTGIALDGKGNLYIASMFGGEVLKVRAGSHVARPYMTVNGPSDVEVRGSTLYATTNFSFESPAEGQLVSKKL